MMYFVLGVDSACVAEGAGRVLVAPVSKLACFLPLALFVLLTLFHLV